MNTTSGRVFDELPDRLSAAERRVARFLRDNRAAALTYSAAEIAAAAATSDATVIRTARALGYSGLPGLRAALAQGLQAPASPADKLRGTLDETGADVDRAVGLALSLVGDAIGALQQHAPRLRQAVGLLAPCARIVVFGMGPSGAVARYAAAVLARNGRLTAVLDASGRALADQLAGLRSGDGLIMLAFGTLYREATATFREAGRLGLPVVLLTDGIDGKLAAMASLTIPVQRGNARHVALMGGPFAALEAIALGLAVADPAAATAALDRLNRLRATLERAGGNPGLATPAG